MGLQEKCRILQFADLGDERGKLVVIEGGVAVPFDIQINTESTGSRRTTGLPFLMHIRAASVKKRSWKVLSYP